MARKSANILQVLQVGLGTEKSCLCGVLGNIDIDLNQTMNSYVWTGLELIEWIECSHQY